MERHSIKIGPIVAEPTRKDTSISHLCLEIQNSNLRSLNKFLKYFIDVSLLCRQTNTQFNTISNEKQRERIAKIVSRVCF